MKSRVFNRTGRVRIEHADWLMTLDEDGKTLSLEHPPADAPWTEAMRDASPTAAVHVDILAAMLQSRETIGPIQDVLDSETQWAIQLPASLPPGKAFSVEIVIADEHAGGRILARSEPRRFTSGMSGGGHASSEILVVTGDVGDRVWALDLDETGPTIVISDRIADWHMVAKMDGFRMLVIGEVLERIYREIAHDIDRFDWMTRFMDGDSTGSVDDRPQLAEYDNDRDAFREGVDQWARQRATTRCGRLGSPTSDPISAVDRFLSDLETRESNRG